MINFTTINVDDVLRKWTFNGVEDLRDEYYSDFPDIPSLDDPVVTHDLPGHINDFGDIIQILGIDTMA